MSFTCNKLIRSKLYASVCVMMCNYTHGSCLPTNSAKASFRIYSDEEDDAWCSVCVAWFECEEGYVAYYVSKIDVAPNDEYKWMKFGLVWFRDQKKSKRKWGRSLPQKHHEIIMCNNQWSRSSNNGTPSAITLPFLHHLLLFKLEQQKKNEKIQKKK